MVFLWVIVVGLIPLVLFAWNGASAASRAIKQLELRVRALEREFAQELSVDQKASRDTTATAGMSAAKASANDCWSCGAQAQMGEYCLECGSYLREVAAAQVAPIRAAVMSPASAAVPNAAERSGTAASVSVPVNPERSIYSSSAYQPTPSLFDRMWTRFRETKDWEVLVGGRLLNRIGAIAVIIGLGLFFKYAVDSNWISEPLRVGIGLAVGIGGLILAARADKRDYRIFAQGLVGAGVAILYLSVYASYNFYHLVPALVALVAMFVVTAVGFQQALRYDSITVALLSLFGGFLTPLIESRLHPNQYGLFIYVFLLEVGILAIASRKPRWIVLEPLTLAGAYLSFLLWCISSYQASHWLSTVLLLTLIWIPFYAYDVYLLGRVGVGNREVRHVLAAVNGIAYYIGLYFLIAPHHYNLIAPVTAAFAALYVLTTIYAVRRTDDARAISREALTAIILAALAPALAFHGLGLTIAWTLEALALVGMGSFWKRTFLWAPGLALYVLAVGALAVTPESYRFSSVASFVPVINTRALTMVLLAAALAVSAVTLKRVEDKHMPTIRQVLAYGSTAIFFMFLTVETNDFFRRLILHASGSQSTRLSYERYLAIGLLWMAYSLPLIWVGLRRSIPPLVWSGLVSSAAATGMVAVVGARFEPIHSFIPILNVRAASIAVVIGALFAQYRWLKARASDQPAFAQFGPAFQVVMVALGFELMTVEVNDFFRSRVSSHAVISEGLFVELMVLSGLWMLYSLPLIWAGIHRRITTLTGCGLLAAAAAVIAGMAEGVLYQPKMSFANVLGLRAAIVLLLIGGLLVELQWIRKGQALHEWLGPVLAMFQAAVVILGLALISVETRDIFAYLIQPSPKSHVAANANQLRNLEQLALSLVWLCYAICILVVGIWRRIRWLRLGAITLFGCIIVKIFAYDLGFLQAGLRYISFVVLGLILLGVSFLYQRYRAVLLDVTA